MGYIKVKNKDHLVRDSKSNGIVNMDETGYKNYLDNYKRIYNESKKIESIETEMNVIKDDINEIKSMLRDLINGPK